MLILCQYSCQESIHFKLKNSFQKVTLTRFDDFFYFIKELILPLNDFNQTNKFIIWGVLLCFRCMIIHIAELDKSSVNSNPSGTLAQFSTSSMKKSYEDPNGPKKNASPSQQSSNLRSPSKKMNISYFNLTNLCEVNLNLEI